MVNGKLVKIIFNALSIVQVWESIFENDAHNIVSKRGWIFLNQNKDDNN